ncbi:hypothetical protein EV401DRAFT_2009003 [Pisolithus croceorrhizus]|nr:hypothetical protein EV401DRAFT_2009003 [Pisolithus croceorrhizus]
MIPLAYVLRSCRSAASLVTCILLHFRVEGVLAVAFVNALGQRCVDIVFSRQISSEKFLQHDRFAAEGNLGCTAAGLRWRNE